MADAHRIGRSNGRSQVILSDLHEAGLRIFLYLSRQELRLDTAADRAMLTLRGFAGEQERENAKQRTRGALLARANAGHVTGGIVFGYRNVPGYGGTDSSGNPIRAHVRREPDLEEAVVVRAIFQIAEHAPR